MQEFKENDKDINTRRWVVVDGIPDLRNNQDYMKISNALEESARMISSHGSKKEAICYIPHDKKVSRHSEDVSIDNCALIQFATEKDAMLFSKRYRDTPIVQKFGFHNLRVYTYKDLDKYENLPDQYPKISPTEFQESRNMLWWLLDEDGAGKAFRDQYVIRYRGPEFEETNVFWMDENQTKDGRALCYDASELKEEQKEMTRQYVQWSPNGLYLLTTHPQGVQLWGGPNWQLLNKLKHERVDQIAFSPNETFLITCNEEKYQDNNGEKRLPQVQIWDVLTGDLIISVPFKTIGPAIKLKDKLSGWWPIFKWSFDEKYIAKINSSKGMSAKPKDLDKINIFEVIKNDGNSGDESRYRIQKLGGKSLTVDSLFNIEFSPTDNVLAYTTFAQKDDQAKVTLIGIPSKNSLKHQSLGFDVKKAHLYWQSQGRYLAINMGHSQKATSIMIKSHSIGIMTVKDRNMPFSRTEKLGIVTNFAWEPDGSRYAVIHGGSKRVEPNVTVFQVKDTMHSVDKGSSKIKLTLQKRRCNQLHWAPKGGRLVIAHVDPLRRAGGELEFVDLNRVRHQKDDSQTVKGLIHENMTDIEWDPSGRYLITATTQYLNTTSGDDTRYIIWSYQGDKLYTHKIKYFYQILWRPRPKKLCKLTHQDKQKITAGLTQNGWDKQFKEYDNEQRHKTQNVTVKTNKRKLDAFKKRKEALESRSKDILAKREELRGAHLSANYITKTLHERLEKNKVEYVINVNTMKKIINEEIDDFDKWRQQQQQGQ